METLPFSIIIDKFNNFSLCEDEQPYQLRFRRHTHTNAELFIFLEGSAEMVADGETYSLSPFDLLLIPENVPHYIRWTKNSKYRRAYFYVTTEYLRSLGLDDLIQMLSSNCIRSINIANSPFAESLAKASKLAQRASFHAQKTLFEERLLSLYYSLPSLLMHSKRSQAVTLTERAIEYIHKNLDKNLSLQEIASALFVSAPYLHRVFKQQTEMPIMHFVNRTKINQAARLLQNGIPIKEVYLTCGYDNYVTFYRIFKKELGISPSHFKNER